MHFDLMQQINHLLVGLHLSPRILDIVGAFATGFLVHRHGSRVHGAYRAYRQFRRRSR